MIKNLKKILEEKEYISSVKSNNKYWLKKSETLDWFRKPTKAGNFSFVDNVSIKWFEDGKLNVSYNCIDRHAKETPDKVAFIWESDDLSLTKKITYKELLSNVSKFANVLKKNDISKGDVVVIYMPLLLEAVYAMLACSRIGAVHSVVFGGFSAESLRSRIMDCKAKLVITANKSVRGGRNIELKKNVDVAIKGLRKVSKVIVVKRVECDTKMNKKDVWYHEEVKGVSNRCKPEVMNAEDPLFILYTSGSTGQPKGLVHTTGGYLLYASYTHKKVFGLRKNDVYWCTADIGWITGHSYVVYGPTANGATTLIHEGTPFYPDYSTHFKLVDRHKVNIYYTAPTAIRAIMKNPSEALDGTSRKSLRVLGSVGEPLNKTAWMWYYNKVGNKNCKIVDTWWQTETGGIMITPRLSSEVLKPGCVSTPFYGVMPVIKGINNEKLGREEEGGLCIQWSWPGQARTIFGDHKRFIQTYFTDYPGCYFTGDGAKMDKDGDFWILGRVDDVINVSGHRLGSAELESALNTHSFILESAVIGFPDELTGESLYAFVILKDKSVLTDKESLENEVVLHLREKIGPIAKPKRIIFVDGLPKTRSGKIMRRLLRKLALGAEDLGDTSTLLDSSVLESIRDDLKK